MKGTADRAPGTPPPVPPPPSPGPPSWLTPPWEDTAPAPAPDPRGQVDYFLPTGRSGWSIAAGYLGLLSILPFVGLLAVLTGVLALRQISRDAHLGGNGRAWFGIVAGAIFTTAWVAAFLPVP